MVMPTESVDRYEKLADFISENDTHQIFVSRQNRLIISILCLKAQSDEH